MTTNDFDSGSRELPDREPDDAELDRRLAALTRSIEPEAGNWRRIEQRIGHRSNPFRWPLALAAGLLLGAFGLVLFQAAVERRPGNAMPEQWSLAEADAMRSSAPQARAVATLDASDALASAWRENRDAIGELERALERDPGNRLLLEFLAEARLRQVELIRHSMNPNQNRSIDL